MPHTLYEYLLSAGVDEIPDNLPDMEMRHKPRNFQVTDLNSCLANTRFGLFSDAGVGKTYPMQAYILINVAWGNKVVGIMPPILAPQFIETFEEDFKGSTKYLSHATFNKTAAHRNKLMNGYEEGGNWPDLLLMSYEMFIKLHKVLEPAGYNVLVCDEAQKLRGSESTWHSVIYTYTEDPDNAALILATGTPQHHTPVDAFAMTRLLDRDAYGTLKGFKRRHCVMANFRMKKCIKGRLRTFTVENITGYKNLDVLNKNLYRYASRVTKDQVLPLKAPTIIPVRVQLSPAHLKLYTTLANKKMLQIGENKLITATEAVTLREHLMHLVCNPHLYSEKVIKNSILEEVDTLLDSIATVINVALYAHHNATVETLADYYKDKNPALVYGGRLSSSAKNPKNLARFQKDVDCKLLISHPQSGGVGINLQKVCHYIIFVEPTPIQGDFTQVVARVQRMGQAHAVVIYVLKVAGTIYPSMLSDMLGNSDLAKEVNLDRVSFRELINGSTGY